MKRFTTTLVILFSISIGFSSAFARVRTVEMDSNQMEVIILSMGRATILEFVDSPKKVIIGNSNYFSAEFTGNDVTIQPLSQVSSNIFIYSGHRRFGFQLKVCVCQDYDDLVKIYWKSSFLPLKNSSSTGSAIPFRGSQRKFLLGDQQGSFPETQRNSCLKSQTESCQNDRKRVFLKKKTKKKRKNKTKNKPKGFPTSFKVGDVDVSVFEVFKYKSMYVLDGEMRSSELVLNIETIKVEVIERNGRVLPLTEKIFSKKGEFVKFRLFFRLLGPTDFTLRVKIGHKENRHTILRRWYE